MKRHHNPPQLRCNIDETMFSRAMFFCRFFTGGALIYLALGSLFYWREFLVNTASLGFGSVSVPLAFCLVAAELFLGLFLLLGWFTRATALFAGIITLCCAGIFFAGDYNKIFVALCLLLCAALCVPLMLGPGVISLDYKRSQRHASRDMMRG